VWVTPACDTGSRDLNTNVRSDAGPGANLFDRLIATILKGVYKI